MRVKARGVDFVVYMVSDMRRSVAFYRDLLGIPFEYEEGAVWLGCQVGNLYLMLGGTTGAQPEDDWADSPWAIARWSVSRPGWCEPPDANDYRGGATLW